MVEAVLSPSINIPIGGGQSSSQKLHVSGRKAIQRQYALANQNIIDQTAAYRKAGLHPLFAMGGGGGSIPPGVPIGGSSKPAISGQVSSKTIRPEEAALTNAQLGLIKAQTDEVTARAEASRASTAALTRSARPGATPVPLEFESMTQTVPLPGKPGQLAGSHPAWTKHNLSFGNHPMQLWAPAQETSEIFESVGMWPLIYANNTEAIHKWARGVFKDKSNIGKIGKFGRWILEAFAEEIEKRR